MIPFKKVTSNGKPVNCYGFAKTQGLGTFDPAETAHFYGRYNPAPVSYGVCIEPLHGEYAMNARQGKPPGLPADELQADAALLFFEKPESIDIFISTLQDCKKHLQQKIAEAAQEEYRRKCCGHVVNLQEWKNAHPEIVKRIAGRLDKRAKITADLATFRNSPAPRAEAMQE